MYRYVNRCKTSSYTNKSSHKEVNLPFLLETLTRKSGFSWRKYSEGTSDRNKTREPINANVILIPFSFSSRLFLMKTFIFVGSWIFSCLLNLFQLMKQGLIQYMENFTFIKVLMLILRHEVIFQLKEQGRFIIIFNYGKETIYCCFYSWNRDDFIIVFN